MRVPAALSALTLLAASTVALAAPASASTAPTCLGRKATLVASTPGAFVRGTGKADVIVALAKGARVLAGAGNDVICVGDARLVDGGPGNDRISFVSGVIHGSAGQDTITQRSIAKLRSTVAGGDGTDAITLRGGNAIVHGNKGNDRLVGGTKGKEQLFGDAGQDTLVARGALAVLNGGPGADAFLVPKSVKGRTTVVHDGLDRLNGVPYELPPLPARALLGYDGSPGPTVSAPALHGGPYVPAQDPLSGFSDEPVEGHVDNGFGVGALARDGHRTVGWSLDPGDGSPVHAGQGNPPAFIPHAYLGNGQSIATLTFTDETGLSASTTLRIDHRERPQVALTQPDSAVALASGAVSVPLTLTVAPGATLAAAVVDWDDGTMPVTVTGSTTLSHTFAAAGAYDVTVLAYDDHGGFDEGDAVVRVYDGTDHANLVVEPGVATPLPMNTAGADVEQGTVDAFDVHRAISATGDLPAYGSSANVVEWDFGDGTASSPGPFYAHAYAATGTGLPAQATVHFPAVTTAASSIAVTVHASNGTATLGPPVSTTIGTAVDLQAAASAPTGAALTSVDIDPGDGGDHITGTTTVPASTHTYEVPGVHCPSLTTVDTWGAYRVVSGCPGHTVLATAPVPVVEVNDVFSVDPPDTWMPAVAGVAGAPDRSGPLFSGVVVPSTGHAVTGVTISFGDGSAPLPMTASGDPFGWAADHAYAAPGIYVASITATDSGGRTAIATYTVDVAGMTTTNAVPPSFTDDGTTRTVSLDEAVGPGAQPDFWAVDFGDGQVITGNGAPPATVTTADGAGFGSDPRVTIADDHGYGLDLGP